MISCKTFSTYAVGAIAYFILFSSIENCKIHSLLFISFTIYLWLYINKWDPQTRLKRQEMEKWFRHDKRKSIQQNTRKRITNISTFQFIFGFTKCSNLQCTQTVQSKNLRVNISWHVPNNLHKQQTIYPIF